MERPFSTKELLAAIESTTEDKALGPDGFPTKFLKSCWGIVGREVMDVFEAFYS